MDSMITKFFVPGTTRTVGSKSAFKDKWGKVHLTHAGKHTKSWMDSVKWFALKEYGERRVLLTCAIVLKLTFFRQRPKGHYRTGRRAGELKDSAPGDATTKPDLDKLNRAVSDALTGIVWKDDSQVVKEITEKVYCSEGQKNGVFIEILRKGK